jgi:hypothetical protein
MRPMAGHLQLARKVCIETATLNDHAESDDNHSIARM